MGIFVWYNILYGDLILGRGEKKSEFPLRNSLCGNVGEKKSEFPLRNSLCGNVSAMLAKCF
jgi:hypothetical protein